MGVPNKGPYDAIIFPSPETSKEPHKSHVQKLKNPPPGPATCGTAKKDVANQKIEVKQLKNTGFFSLFACRFWTGAFTNRCLPYCFLQCFLKASVTTYQKQEVLAEKCPPPSKPVTFYECHPEDHAPAPSVRADLIYLAGTF